MKLMATKKTKQHPRFIWMEVTRDQYEFPVHIADTADELAKLVGVKNATSVISAIGKAKKRGAWCKYKKILLENDSEERNNDEN